MSGGNGKPFDFGRELCEALGIVADETYAITIEVYAPANVAEVSVVAAGRERDAEKRWSVIADEEGQQRLVRVMRHWRQTAGEPTVERE